MVKSLFMICSLIFLKLKWWFCYCLVIFFSVCEQLGNLYLLEELTTENIKKSFSFIDISKVFSHFKDCETSNVWKAAFCNSLSRSTVAAINLVHTSTWNFGLSLQKTVKNMKLFSLVTKGPKMVGVCPFICNLLLLSPRKSSLWIPEQKWQEYLPKWKASLNFAYRQKHWWSCAN